ncbi:MAG: hypothetical protein V4712_17655 [Pseudomonadota bacterium]
MELLLILMFAAGPQSAEVEAGQMASQQLCLIAGHSMARTLAVANPGTLVAFRCVPPAGA